MTQSSPLTLRTSDRDGREIVAVFGGSFNPPHIAHVLAVATVLCTTDVDRVIVVPAYQHPFAKQLASYDARVAMTDLAVGWLPRVEVSRVEEMLGGESRTLRTLERLQADHPEWSLRLVVGADILNEAHKWHGFDRIRAIAPLIVLGRAGIQAPGAPEPILPRVSSTDVRAAAACHDMSRLSALVPRQVAAYIEEHKLYGIAQ
jgi:nicotinate-nucleotide adenylyltransferase